MISYVYNFYQQHFLTFMPIVSEAPGVVIARDTLHNLNT